MSITIDDASSAFFAALIPRERWTPSQWAERAPRKLADTETSEPGDWKNDRAPYLADIMDDVADPDVEEIVVLKGAQIGYSESVRNIVGYWCDLDPGPCLTVLPDQLSADAFRDERLQPLLDNTPAVAQHVTTRAWDSQKYRIRLDTMSIFLTWAGSKSGTKQRPIRYLVIEEPDEFPITSGGGGDPLVKAMKRCTTYSDKNRAKILIGGTPTTRQGNIYKRWEMCGERLYMWVPCPHCSGYQQLKWAQVKWPKLEGDRAQQANTIETNDLAFYECVHCQKEIRHHHKPMMLRRRIWAGQDQAVTTDGRVVGERRKARRLGRFVPSYYSPWVTFSKLAAEWLLAQDDRQALMDFINQRLAEPYETISSKVEITVLEEKLVGAPPALVIPSWAQRLIATADTQGQDEKNGYFYYIIRAWGMGWRSQLVDHGMISTKEELYHACFGRTFPIEGRGETACAQFLLIDSGGPRWQEIYSFSQAAPHQIKPAKGANRKLSWMIDKRPQRDHNVILWEVDSQQAKDQLHLLIHNEDRSLWTLNDRATADYCKQLTAEHKVLDKSGVELWQSRYSKIPNHYLDCEALSVAAAWQEGCGMSAPPEATLPKPEPATSNVNRISASDFMNRGRGKW